MLHQSFNFQENLVQCYRCKQSKTRILCLLLSPDDPTTIKETISVILKNLINILLLIPNDSMSKNMPYFITLRDITERYLLVVRDGLSHECWRFYSGSLLNIILEDL